MIGQGSFNRQRYPAFICFYRGDLDSLLRGANQPLVCPGGRGWDWGIGAGLLVVLGVYMSPHWFTMIYTQNAL